VRRRRRRGDVTWWMWLRRSPAHQKKCFCSQNDNKFGCILIQFLAGRKHGQSLEALDADFTVQSRNHAYKNSPKIIQKFTVRLDQTKTVATSPPPAPRPEYVTACSPMILPHSMSLLCLQVHVDTTPTSLYKLPALTSALRHSCYS